MQKSPNINFQEESDFKRILELASRNYKLFIFCLFIAFAFAFIRNRYAIPSYHISSSILIKENTGQQGSTGPNEFINSNLFGRNQNFQNELWVLKSYPVIEKIISNLDLTVSYYSKGKIHYYDAYQNVPFRVTYLSDHVQPIDIKFDITFLNGRDFKLVAESKNAAFYNYVTERIEYRKNKWIFAKNAKLGELIETSDLAFIVQPFDTTLIPINKSITFAFEFKTVTSLTNGIKAGLTLNAIDREATVVSLSLKSESIVKGINIVDELMNVYSDQNLERKNHLANITISYIEKQLNEISDSLIQTEDNLQRFRSSNQLLDIADQSSGISDQYIDLQNQLADLVSQKRYYDYVSDLLANDNFSNLMLPASIGISDQLLNRLMSELLTAQAQRSNLIENNQERNPLVQKLAIQIENLKKTISENIVAVGKTTEISIDEMNKRIRRIEAEISRLPETQRRLGSIERRYRLNDAIYNYLMEKHAEAKITKASNMPDNVIIEPAKMMGSGPISPNKALNYLIALMIGLAFPFGYIVIKQELNNKVVAQDDIERLTDVPVLGKIMHNRYKTRNVMFEFSKSNLAESFRALRTNLDFYVRGGHKKVILVTSCIEGEGKSFVSLNLAMSYAQLGRRTILLDFDLRKPQSFFKEYGESQVGLSSYLIDKTPLEDIIIKSPHDKLDYIISGIIPPNPVELLALEKTELLFTKLKDEYDIIVVDSTPLAQVTDAYLLFDRAELKIIIARHNFTLKKVFSLIMKDLEIKKVSNVCVVLNDNRIYSDQYGYGYGYYNKGRSKKRNRQIGEYHSK